jgi:hypothetical protein
LFEADPGKGDEDESAEGLHLDLDLASRETAGADLGLGMI